MKKLIPYILSYLIVASGTAAYPYIYLHFTKPVTDILPHTVLLLNNPGLSQAELDAKLRQVGLSVYNPHTDKMPPLPSRPSRLYSLTYHYIFDAVMLSAFAGLVILFRRTFQAVVPDRGHAG